MVGEVFVGVAVLDVDGLDEIAEVGGIGLRSPGGPAVGGLLEWQSDLLAEGFLKVLRSRRN